VTNQQDRERLGNLSFGTVPHHTIVVLNTGVTRYDTISPTDRRDAARNGDKLNEGITMRTIMLAGAMKYLFPCTARSVKFTINILGNSIVTRKAKRPTQSP
jgi:hypothetical protein